MDVENKSHTPPTGRIKRVYLIALSIIAVLSISAQLLVQYTISIGEQDATIINLAGRQRMLSQNIAKNLVLITSQNTVVDQKRKSSLAANFELFELSHATLKEPSPLSSQTFGSAEFSNSPVIKILLQDIDDEIAALSQHVTRAISGESLTRNQLEQLLNIEQRFLVKMDHIVSQYESEATARLSALKQLEALLLSIILITLALEARFIFRPLAEDLGRYFQKFKETDKKLNVTNRNLERSVQEKTTQFKEAIARMEAIVDNAADAIISIDVEGKILSFNKAATSIFGYKENEVLGESVDRLIPETELLNHKKIIDNYQKTGVSKIIGVGRQVKGKRKSGRELQLHLAISEVSTDQGTIFTGILRDISLEERLKEERKKAVEHALDVAQEKSEMFAYMSHEIRTPLNGVLGMLNLIDKSQLGEQQKHQLALVESSANTLLSVVNEILDYSKMDADKLTLEKTEFDIHKLLDELIHLAATKAYENGVDIRLDLTELPLTLVEGDPIRLRQIIDNLLNNALKFTHQGHIKVSCGIFQESSLDNDIETYFNCSVEDTGIGISVAKLKNLFSPFVQSDSDTTRKYGGTGLGLAIVKQLCDKMGGDISVISEENHGSNFSFRVPLTFLDKPILFSSVAFQSAGSNDHTLPLAEKHIALFQSDTASRNLIATQLTLWGATVSCLDEAREALTWMRQLQANSKSAPDLILIDQHLADSPGMELGDRLKQIQFENQPPVILQCTQLSTPSPEQLSQLNFNSVLLKPITTTNLANQLKAFLFSQEEELSNRINRSALSVPKDTSQIRDPRLNQATNASTLEVSVLLVEDNEINQEVAFGLLTNLEFTTTLATQGKQALEILNQSTEKKFDLIVTDCMMPVLDGYNMTQEIRAGSAGEQYLNIPIIALTASTMEGDKEKCINAGMNDFVSKPIEASSLTQAIQRCLPELKNILISHQNSKNNVSEKNLSTQFDQHIDDVIRACWNREAFIQRVGDDADRIIKLIRVILEQLPKNLSELATAIESKDWDQAKVSAHTIKGNSANLGATHASMTATAMEFIAANGDRSKLHDLLNVLQSDIEIVEHLLEQEISNQEQAQVNYQQKF